MLTLTRRHWNCHWSSWLNLKFLIRNHIQRKLRNEEHSISNLNVSLHELFSDASNELKIFSNYLFWYFFIVLNLVQRQRHLVPSIYEYTRLPQTSAARKFICANKSNLTATFRT